ncbi:MAG: glycoside hydrolase family 2 protein [Patescibacteria group bacterium]
MGKPIKLLLLLSVAVLALPVRAASPPPVPGQPAGCEVYDLGGEWSFAADPAGRGEENKWYRPGFEPPGAETVSVPHTWNTMRAWRDYEGVAWYRKSFAGPRAAAGRQTRLVFDAAFYLARVWFNGVFLGAHEGGYTRFEFDVTKLLRPGELNLIAVRLDNRRDYDRVPAKLGPSWSYDWWGYGGLVRDVSLVSTGPVYVHHALVSAVPAESGRGELEIRAFLENATGREVPVELLPAVYPDGGGAPLWTGDAVAAAAPAGRGEVRFKAVVPNLEPWHFDRPVLYRLELGLRAKGFSPGTYRTTFGVRRVEIRGTGLYLNGERVRLSGVTRHADSAWYGSAEPVAMMRWDFDQLKLLNTTLTRPVHYPQHRFILDYCDRNGILLIPEVPAWQLSASQMSDAKVVDLVKQQLREMIETDYNHPCIWAWSLCNEIDSTSAAGKEFVKTLYGYVKSLDPTRPVSFASNRLGWLARAGDEASDLVDFIMMNQYFGTWAGRKQDLEPALDNLHRIWPDRMIVISEFGYEPNWPFGPRPEDTTSFYVAPGTAPPLQHDRQRQAVIREQMAAFRRRDYIAAAVFWCYADYRTPANFRMGLVDAERRPLPSRDLLAAEYAPAVLDSLVTMATRTGNFYGAELVLHARGPVEREMPAYTLRGYRLRWTVLDANGGEFCSGTRVLPTLAPGAVWRYAWDYEAPSGHSLVVEILRPTGFPILTRTVENRN